MKKVFIKLVVISLIVHSISGATGCIHAGQHLHSKRDDVNDRAKRGSILVPAYQDNDSSDEARERTSAEVEDFIQNMLVKTKRNLEKAKDIIDPRNVTQTPEASNQDDAESYIRMKAVTDPKEFIKQLIEARKARKEKRNTDSDDPIAMVVDRKFIKPRKARQKKYMCYCQEQCQGRQCRSQGHKVNCPWKDKMYPNVKEYVDDEYENSAEETVGAYSNGYTNKIVSAPSTTTEPTKFTIPFANNVNFDQRVIVGGKDPLSKKPQKIAPFYQNPHVRMPPSQPHLVYPYNTFLMPPPGIIFHGPPIRPNYPPPNRPKVASSKIDIPSPFGSNFPNINECIKLYGRTVCVISSTSRSPITKVETIDLSDDKTYTDEEEPTQKPPVYPTQYVYQTSQETTPKVMVNEPPVGHRYYIDKNYFDGSGPNSPYPNNQYNYEKAQSANIQVAKPNQGGATYLPSYPTVKTAANANYDSDLHNQQPIQQSQGNGQDVTKYSVQTLRTTTPKLIIKEGNIPHTAPSSDYVPKYSSKEIETNPNEYVPKYSSKESLGNSNPIYNYPNSFNGVPQNTPLPEVTTPVYSNVQQPKYYETANSAAAAPQPTSSNNAGGQYPHYLYTTDMHTKKNTDPSVDSFKPVTSEPPVQNYYAKTVADQKPTYTYSSGYENAPANAALPTAMSQEHNKYNYNYQGSLTGASQQYNTGNPNVNNNNQYEAVLSNHPSNADENHLTFNIDKSTYNETPQIKLPNLPNSQNKHLKFLVDESAYNIQQNSSPQSNHNHEPVVSSQTVITQAPSLIRNADQSIVIQPPELYKIENLSSTTDILGNPISATNVVVPVKDGNHPEDIQQPVTTLEDVETDEYKSHFKEEKTATLREANVLIQRQTEATKLNRENIAAKHSGFRKNIGKPTTIKTLPTNKESFVKPGEDNTEELFRGLEKIILENDYADLLSQESDSQKPIYGQAGGSATEKGKQSKNYATSKPTKPGSTQSSIQSVDDRPVVTYENSSEGSYPSVTARNVELVQSAVKKVINNLVPGKAQDLLANYEEGSSSDLVGASAQELLPEILEVPILKNLFSLPEIENMITDTTGNLLTRVTGLPIIGNIPHLIRNTLHSVIGQIPRPHPTVAPDTIYENPTIEEHKFENGQWVTERVPLYETDPNVGASKEIFEKIESILSRSQLEDKVATHPIVQNLIVKAVKHTLDKERGIVEESTIRRAFDSLIKAKAQNQAKFIPATKRIPTERKPLVVQPTATTPMDDDDYKLAPIVPVTEHVFRGGSWSESQKTLTGKQQKDSDVFSEEKRKLLQEKLDQQQKSVTVSKSKSETVSYSSEERSSSGFNEEKRRLLQEKLDKQQVSKTKSKNESIAYETEQLQKLDAANVKEKSDRSKILGAKSSIITKKLENETSENMELPADDEDQSIERKPIKYYSPNDRILEYIKNHPSTDNPYLTTTAEIVGYTNEDNIETTTRQMNFRGPEVVTSPYTPDLYENLGNTLYVKPSLAQPKQQSGVSNVEDHQQPSLGNPLNQQINDDRVKLLVEPTDAPVRSKQGTEATRQTYLDSRDSNYMGKLVPLPYSKTSQTGDLTQLQDSNLMYVGDGVRLPLTIRKAPDGSFVLTLSDEVCKRFEHKECPCCLPSGNNGVIVRERRSREETSEMDLTGEETSATSEESSSNLSRVRRGSEEFRMYPEESPEYITREEEKEAKVNQFVTAMANMHQVPEESRPTALLGALGELVSPQPSTIDFVTQSTNTHQTYPPETTRNQYEMNDRSKKDTTRSTTLWDTYYYDEYQSPSTTEPNPGVFGSLIDGLKRATAKYRTDPPYRYQRYAEDNFKTNAIKRVLHLMHSLAVNLQQNKS
ncbi:hypothetical protein TSAR_003844 [Trichomalopsis sarcophagae]|uniref:Uncharacterized protein n=1 Tax=Trichomalopsis sarcophagae TaxID=543379 RepID=A0A232FN00_9HYME|nr:hypothetical protein TSAR_003844 [Trichomalopsis sarcophagae]